VIALKGLEMVLLLLGISNTQEKQPRMAIKTFIKEHLITLSTIKQFLMSKKLEAC
jgi:hypothetical protein